MTISNLEKEEVLFLKRCITRLHKEHGTYYFFIKNKKYRLLFHDKRGAIPEILVDLVWDIFIKAFGGGVEKRLLSSSYQLEIIDLLSKHESESLQILCKQIASFEFSYINTELEDLGQEDYNRLNKEIIDKINTQYKKYTDLLPRNSFEYLPITR